MLKFKPISNLSLSKIVAGTPVFDVVLLCLGHFLARVKFQGVALKYGLPKSLFSWV